MPPHPPSVPPETIADFTSPDLIQLNVQAPTAPLILTSLCNLFHQRGLVDDPFQLEKAVLSRESISPTAFMSGWAFPHGRLPQAQQLAFVFARTSQPVSWFGHNPSQVHTIFLFLVPERDAKPYLNLISALTRLTQNLPLMERLRSVSDPAEAFNLFKEVPLLHPTTVAPSCTQLRLVAPSSA